MSQNVVKKPRYQVAKPPAKPKPSRPRKGYWWERIRATFNGTHVTPSKVTKRFHTIDRAYACRVLQSLQRKGYATAGPGRGEYKILPFAPASRG